MTPPRLTPGMVVLARLRVDAVAVDMPWGESARLTFIDRRGRAVESAGCVYARPEHLITVAEAKKSMETKA